MAQSWAVAGSEEDTLLVEVTGQLAAYYEVLAEGQMFLSAEQKARLAQACQGMGLAIQRLRQIAQEQGRLCWPVRPKTHKMCHFPFFAQSINPAAVSCYRDESHMGTCANIWKRSVAGRWKRAVQKMF